MIVKILAIVSLVMLPLSVSLWHRSHRHPVQYRYDVTGHKSLRVYLKNGVCGLHMLSMPRPTAFRSEFQAILQYDALPGPEALLFSTARQGPYRTTWVVFPFWLSTLLTMTVGALPIVQGPVRRWWRRRRGRCVTCDYDLTGNRSGRCPECGDRVR